MIYASSSANDEAFFEDAGLGDRLTTGSHTGTYYHYIVGCDPEDGNPVD